MFSLLAQPFSVMATFDLESRVSSFSSSFFALICLWFRHLIQQPNQPNAKKNKLMFSSVAPAIHQPLNFNQRNVCAPFVNISAVQTTRFLLGVVLIKLKDTTTSAPHWQQRVRNKKLCSKRIVLLNVNVKQMDRGTIGIYSKYGQAK